MLCEHKLPPHFSLTLQPYARQKATPTASGCSASPGRLVPYLAEGTCEESEMACDVKAGRLFQSA